MKILITGNHGGIMPPPYSGVKKRLLLHAKEWTKAGHSVFFLASYKHKNEDAMKSGVQAVYECKNKKNSSIIPKIMLSMITHPIKFFNSARYYTRFEGFSLENISYFPFSEIVSEKIIKKLKPDLIISHIAYGKTLGITNIAKRHNIPLIIENYAEVQFRKAKEKDENIAEKYAPLYRYILGNADLVISASEHCTKGPLKYVPREKVRIVFSGINYPQYRPYLNVTKEEAKKKIGFEKKKIILSVGKLHWRKGQHYVAGMAQDLIDKIGDDVVFIFIGKDGGLKENLMSQDPGNRFFFRTNIPEEEMPYYYRGADVFLFPSVSDRECMGMAMKESMLCGTPVIAFNSGGIGEAITHNETGYLVKTMDLKGFKEHIINLLKDRKLIKKVSKNAEERSRELFSSAITGKQYLKEIEALMRKKGY